MIRSLSHNIYLSLLSSKHLLRHATSARPKLSRLLHSLAQDDRQTLRVRGEGCGLFLQGLVSNDIQHLQNGASSMYSMIVNSQGRVVHDVIIYNSQKENQPEEYLVEVQSVAIEKLARHLKMYRLRKKLDIDICSDMKCWVIFDPNIDFDSISKVDLECFYMNPRVDSKTELNITNETNDIIITRDPRMKYLGHKLILPLNNTPDDFISSLTPSDLESYTNLRYRLGVAEGCLEIPSGGVTPLEANVDYLHGISFHKGCYIGQELSARVHHTGVVRKRYMPLVFTGGAAPTAPIPAETSVVNSKGKAVGRMRAHSGVHGIALLKIAECIAENAGLSVAGHPVMTFKPAWWPIEAKKQID